MPSKSRSGPATPDPGDTRAGEESGDWPLARKLSFIRQKLKTLERYLRFYRKSMRAIPETPFGFRLMGGKAMQEGRFEPDETKLMNQILPHCDVFVNVGANVGYYCCHALHRGVQVYAFEPYDLNVRYLLANVRANGWDDRIEIYPVALGKENGILEMFGAGTSASLIRGWAGTPELDVSLAPVLVMDQVLADRLTGKRCLIMVDIEGAEHLMLAGAGRILAANPRPVWIIEICIDIRQPRGANINPHLGEVFDRFWNNGYEAWTATATPRRVTPEEIVAIVDGGKNTVETHNFIFVDPGSRDMVPALAGEAAGKAAGSNG